MMSGLDELWGVTKEDYKPSQAERDLREVLTFREMKELRPALGDKIFATELPTLNLDKFIVRYGDKLRQEYKDSLHSLKRVGSSVPAPTRSAEQQYKLAVSKHQQLQALYSEYSKNKHKPENIQLVKKLLNKSAEELLGVAALRHEKLRYLHNGIDQNLDPNKYQTITDLLAGTRAELANAIKTLESPKAAPAVLPGKPKLPQKNSAEENGQLASALDREILEPAKEHVKAMKKTEPFKVAVKKIKDAQLKNKGQVKSQTPEKLAAEIECLQQIIGGYDGDAKIMAGLTLLLAQTQKKLAEDNLGAAKLKYGQVRSTHVRTLRANAASALTAAQEALVKAKNAAEAAKKAAMALCQPVFSNPQMSLKLARF